jgi:hypothetical protein
MKNQYFADKRDFAKYELLLDLVEGIPGTCRLTIIPMLTAPDGTGEGRRTKYECGNRRPKLYEFLMKCLDQKRRDIRCLREYLGSHRFTYSPYRDEPPYFTHQGRCAYFRGVPNDLLESAVVFLDPDIGLPPQEDEPPPRNNLHKYLFWEDAEALAGRTSVSSVLVIYQHLQFDKRKIQADIDKRCNVLARRLGTRGVFYMTDKDIAFFIVTWDSAMHGHVMAVLEQQELRHSLRYGNTLSAG